MGLHVEHTDSDDIHSSSGEVFTHVRVVIATTVSGSLFVFNLLLTGALVKTNFTDHVGHGQVLAGLTPVVGTCNLVDVCTAEVATNHNCKIFGIVLVNQPSAVTQVGNLRSMSCEASLSRIRLKRPVK